MAPRLSLSSMDDDSVSVDTFDEFSTAVTAGDSIPMRFRPRLVTAIAEVPENERIFLVPFLREFSFNCNDLKSFYI